MEPAGSVHNTAAAGKGEKKLTCQNPAWRRCYFVRVGEGPHPAVFLPFSLAAGDVTVWALPPGRFLSSAGAKEQVCQLAGCLLASQSLAPLQVSSASLGASTTPRRCSCEIIPSLVPSPGCLEGDFLSLHCTLPLNTAGWWLLGV